ncbi:hypothetical protein EJ04DRAFT_513328 [Polyplosphaeria fusca]|uniref:Uncharacterized protein n=1 Tax=Polyplosphaeria fusca TaxID=682080 RepID=A0A9P4QVI4_9PLEO|nr:hypothetical protein EJ04DRAFT_513328 [Polyplosphaeria fusca]
MSALPRARRSMSKTASETGGTFTASSTTIPIPNSHLPASSPPSSSPVPDAPSSSPMPDAPSIRLDPDLRAASTDGTTMLDMLSAAAIQKPRVELPTANETPEGAGDDLPDNRSSSLSELGDASDEQSEPTPRPSTLAELDDNDSEAETERMEKTPRKLIRTATNTSITSEQIFERTPSKLAHSKTLDQDESAPPTPSIATEETLAINPSHANAGLESLSMLATSEAANLEAIGKKRKRSSLESSPADDLTEEPAPKRSSTSRETAINGSQEAAIDVPEHMDVEEELDHAEERISQLAQEDVELEERQANVALEAVSELATVANLSKPRKGGRKGKRKANNLAAANAESVAPAEDEGEVEGENDEEDSAMLDEEAAKKKNAIDQLAKIERRFKIFREKLCDEQITQYEQELEMLKQPNCTHPEYLAMIQCLDERRNEKIAYERQLLQYKQKCLEIKTVAERHQMHSQYLQTVRDVRESILSECNQRVHELQRGRRQLGVEEVEYALKLPEKRSEQIRHQAAYNLEVSILSGVAKYVGFPAAPEIKAARSSEVEDDLRAMKITSRPAPVPYVRHYNRTSAADEAAAEEQFIERTPWANPHHPSHQQAQYAPGPARVPNQPYQTPAGQRHAVDIHAPNGSASTIEANSNPPSSTVHGGYHSTSNGRVTESESPVLQMKRHPGDQPQVETPGSLPRNFGAVSQHAISSPATSHLEQPLDDPTAARWGGNGVRPLNAAQAGASGGSSLSGRPSPIAQRTGVSVGSGGGLFGR